MAASPLTRPSLLVRVRDARDDQAWGQFGEVYIPLIYGFARRHGLQDADAADLTQEVMRRVAGAVRNLEYDPQRGSFRGWLFTVVRNQLRAFQQSRRPRDEGTGRSSVLDLLNEQPAREEEEAAQWDEEYEQRLFTCAAHQIRGDFRDSTWQAFWQTGVEGKNAKDVAQQLGLTVAAVYLAKSRVMARLKEQIKLLQEG